jgi:NhaP-type Na+/H+ or K+/H+ antiporter
MWTVTPSPLEHIGALCFGLVIGYLTYRVLVRTTDRAAITDLTAIVGAVGGAAVTGLFDPGTGLFAMYSIGLAAGLAAYAIIYARLNGRTRLAEVLGGATEPAKPAPIDPERPL